MDVKKLRTLEKKFLEEYPEGFQSEELLAIGKKHKMEKMKTFVEENFEKDKFDDVEDIMIHFTKLISMSSLVSVFEKAKFKDLVKVLSPEEKGLFVKGIYEFLYGEQALGFEMQIDVLGNYKLAKWPILTVIGVYSSPDYEVLVKPTTVKAILKYFEIEEFKYSPKASYEFYQAYRAFIKELRNHTNETLKVETAAFCGFLMMSME